MVEIVATEPEELAIVAAGEQISAWGSRVELAAKSPAVAWQNEAGTAVAAAARTQPHLHKHHKSMDLAKKRSIVFFFLLFYC